MGSVTATSPPWKQPRSWFALACLSVVAAVIVGVALLQRGSDRTIVDSDAERPFTMPDGRRLFVQRFEVTVSQWITCARHGGCKLTLRARPGQEVETTPATGLSHADAQEYLAWINHTTGHSFRLPTAAEWVAMAEPVLPEKPDPIFTDPALSWASTYVTGGTTPRALKPQGSFSTTREGIDDLDGSVWEWTQDCYATAGADATPNRCPAFIVGGEHLAAVSYLIRDPARGGCAVGSPPAHLGLRLVSDESYSAASQADRATAKSGLSPSS